MDHNFYEHWLALEKIYYAFIINCFSDVLMKKRPKSYINSFMKEVPIK